MVKIWKIECFKSIRPTKFRSGNNSASLSRFGLWSLCARSPIWRFVRGTYALFSEALFRLCGLFWMSREGVGIREFDDMGDVPCDKLRRGLLFTKAGVKLRDLECVDLLGSSLSGPSPEVVPCVALGSIEAAPTISPAGLLELSRVPAPNSCELPVAKSSSPFWWESPSWSTVGFQTMC